MQHITIPAAIVVAGALIAGSIIFTSQPTNPTTAPSTGTAAAEQPTPEISFELSGFPALGDPDAPVTIVEYSDFACPFCKRFVDETKPQIRSEYIDQGLVHFVRKDMISVGGTAGYAAAMAAHCAGDQGAYFSYHNLMLDNQAADRGRWTDLTVHEGYATELGLDTAAFMTCLESEEHRTKVSASTQEGRGNGGSGTPFFVINDVPVSGAQPYAVFQEIIEAELAAQ